MDQQAMDHFIRQTFNEHLSSIQRTIQDPHLIRHISAAAEIMATALSQGNKILFAGNGGSATQADHFAEELVAKYHKERKALPAISLTHSGTLTCTANDWNFDYVFARQVEAFGKSGDVFYGYTTSGNSKNILQALDAAHQRNMKTIVLSGKNGGLAATPPWKPKINCLIIIPDDSTARIQEAHDLLLHIHCELIERTLFPELYSADSQ